MEAGDADVLVDEHLGAEQLRPDPRLVQNGPVGGARGDHRHAPANLRDATRHPDSAGALVLLGVRRDLADRGARGLVGSRREDAARAGVEQRRHDRRHLLGRLSLCQHCFGSALANLAVRVHAGEAEVAVRQLGEAVESVLGRDVAAADLLQELGEVGAEVGHAPIIATG